MVVPLSRKFLRWFVYKTLSRTKYRFTYLHVKNNHAALFAVLLALDQLGVPVDAAYTSEVDEDGQLIARARHPSLIQLGDINPTRDRFVL